MRTAVLSWRCLLEITTWRHALRALHRDAKRLHLEQVSNLTVSRYTSAKLAEPSGDVSRRWMEKAARGSHLVTSADIQKTLNKWLPRGLEMFGDERGGGTNVRCGLKPLKNQEAQGQYYEEVLKLLRDINLRYVRARLPKLGVDAAETVLDRILDERKPVEGIAHDDLVHAPHREFFRRRGVPAFQMIGWAGEKYSDVDAYLTHLSKHLPDSYRANRDFLHYVDLLKEIEAGTKTAAEAARSMPALRRVGGVCPCSKSVRWVSDDGVNGSESQRENTTATT